MNEYLYERYEVGDKVLHETFGICVVKRIEQLVFGNKKIEYYRLESCDEKKHVIYVPVAYHEMKIKKVMTH